MILDELIASTRVELARRKADQPEEILRERVDEGPPTLDICSALRRPGVSIVAEIKRASPSRGALNPGLDPAKLALVYASAGADAISVLTEGRHFCGSLGDLARARGALAKARMPTPLLRKDFVLDPYQLLEARLWGADAVLLIAAILDDRTLASLAQGALALGLTPLVEIHDQKELERVLPLEPPLVGINNRDLRDFTVDLAVTRRLRPLIPPSCTVIAESGIHGAEQISELAQLQVDAALVGEALVTATNPAAKLRALKEASR